jgi:hypothetical protein
MPRIKGKKMPIRLFLLSSALAAVLPSIPAQAAQTCEGSAIQQRYKDYHWDGIEKNLESWKGADTAKKTVAFAKGKINLSITAQKTLPIKKGILAVCDYTLVASLAEGTAHIDEIRDRLLKVSPQLAFDGKAFVIRGTYTEGGSAGVLDWVRRDGDDPMFEEKIANLSDIIYANQPRYFPNK